MPKVADYLRVVGEGVEVVVGWLDFDHSALGVLEDLRFGVAASAAGLREETAVGHSGALIAELRGEKDCGLQFLSSRV